MKLTLWQKTNGAILITFCLISVIFSAIAFPIEQKRLEQKLADIETLLQTLVERDREPLANEIFEERLLAIQIRLREMLKVRNVLAIAVFRLPVA